MGSIHEERDKKNRIREMFYSNRVRQLVEEKRTLSHEKFPEQDAMKRDNLADYRYSIEKVKGKPEQWSNRETEQSNRETEKSNRETQRAIRTK